MITHDDRPPRIPGDNSRITSTFADWCKNEREGLRENLATMDAALFHGVQRDEHIAMIDKFVHDMVDSYTTLLEVLETIERDRK